jgi:hypothetical protein
MLWHQPPLLAPSHVTLSHRVHLHAGFKRRWCEGRGGPALEYCEDAPRTKAPRRGCRHNPRRWSPDGGERGRGHPSWPERTGATGLPHREHSGSPDLGARHRCRVSPNGARRSRVTRLSELLQVETSIDPSVQMVMPYSPLAPMLQLDEPCQTYYAISPGPGTVGRPKRGGARIRPRSREGKRQKS